MHPDSSQLFQPNQSIHSSHLASHEASRPVRILRSCMSVFGRICGVVVLSLFPAAAAADHGDGELHVQTSESGTNYYHVEFVLTPDNTRLQLMNRDVLGDGQGNATSDGQFEIYVKRRGFPVPVGSFNRYLILRMSATENAELNPKKVKAKQKLYAKIRKMVERGKGKVHVVLELNPYVERVSNDPVRVRLTERNIFFRHAHGRYIDYLGDLKRKHLPRT